MPRYIDADKVLTDELTHTLPNECGMSSGRVIIFVDDIEKIPTADVQEVRHGYWIEKGLDNFRKVECSCSICGWSGVENYDSYVDIHDFDFCPNCGALMDGEEAEAKLKELEGIE